MLEAFKFFDAYGLRARVFPALIAGLPALALLAVLVPWNGFGLPHTIAVAMSFVLLFAFADVARRMGRKVEAKLGTRSTPELLFRSDPTFDRASKDRYRDFLAKKIKGKAPTESDENANPSEARAFYNSAGNWLREHTRDKKKFNILFDELVTYGFRRNLLGLKLVALLMNGVVVVVSALGIMLPLPYLKSIENSGAKLIIVIIAALMHSVYMIFAVSGSSVTEASKTYGRQLILSCENLMGVSRVSSKAKGEN